MDSNIFAYGAGAVMLSTGFLLASIVACVSDDSVIADRIERLPRNGARAAYAIILGLPIAGMAGGTIAIGAAARPIVSQYIETIGHEIHKGLKPENRSQLTTYKIA
jgi:hypothetical protein